MPLPPLPDALHARRANTRDGGIAHENELRNADRTLDAYHVFHGSRERARDPGPGARARDSDAARFRRSATRRDRSAAAPQEVAFSIDRARVVVTSPGVSGGKGKRRSRISSAVFACSSHTRNTVGLFGGR